MVISINHVNTRCLVNLPISVAFRADEHFLAFLLPSSLSNPTETLQIHWSCLLCIVLHSIHRKHILDRSGRYCPILRNQPPYRLHHLYVFHPTLCSQFFANRFSGTGLLKRYFSEYSKCLTAQSLSPQHLRCRSFNLRKYLQEISTADLLT